MRKQTMHHKDTIAARKAEYAAYRYGTRKPSMPDMRRNQQAQHILRMRYSLASDALAKLAD
jgi:hypothetical protein